MAEKDLGEPSKVAHPDTTVVVSYDREPAEQALISESPPHDTLAVVFNLDIIFTILCFLPTEVVLRLRTVCRAWAQLISDPSFIRAHSSRPALITGFFAKESRRKGFKPLQSSPKFPSMITTFLSSGFEAVSTSHGLVCFHREKDEVIIVVNPATSHWALIPWVIPSPLSRYDVRSHVLIYDPAMSFHFKLSIGTSWTVRHRYSFASHHSRFHIYSTETSSWTTSSVYPPAGSFNALWPKRDWQNCIESRIGGGSVCRWGNIEKYSLNGYEIASDMHWETLVPEIREESDEGFADNRHLVARDGEIYYVYFDSEKKLKILRLDEKKSWIFEGEHNTGDLQELLSCHSFFIRSYDPMSKILFIELFFHGRWVLFIWHLLSSRFEFVDKSENNWCSIKLPHVNTLAPFHGGKQDTDALNQLLGAVELDDDSDNDDEWDGRGTIIDEWDDVDGYI